MEGMQYPGQQYFNQLNSNPDLLMRQNYQTPSLVQKSPQQYPFSVFPQMSTFPKQNLYAQQQQQQPFQQFKAPEGGLIGMTFPNQQQQQQQQIPIQTNQLQLQQQQQSQSNSSIVSPPSSHQLTSPQQENENHKKSGEKALHQFQLFLQMTQSIGSQDLSLDFVKDLYSIKMDELPSNKEMLDIYHKIISKQGYSKQQKKNWNDMETNLLVWIILKSSVLKHIDFRAIQDDLWEDIATMMVGRNAEQCKLKWLSMSKLNLQQQPWCDQEDNYLTQIIKEYESKNKLNKWSEISVKLNQISHKNVFRQGKQCRERWNNHLDPNINRGPWTQEEELIMLKLVLDKGKRWSEISKNMKSSRTENSVKNRFNSLVKKGKSSSSNDLKHLGQSPPSAQDLTEQERAQVIEAIDKFESRIKNGFNLLGGWSGKNQSIEEEDQDEDNDEYEDDGNDDSKTNKSLLSKHREENRENHQENSSNHDEQEESQSVQSQQLSYQIKTEEQSAPLLPPPPPPPCSKLSHPKQAQKKNILQSKNALFQLVESEAKIKSEQTLNQSDHQINSHTTIFQPINKEIPIPHSSENNLTDKVHGGGFDSPQTFHRQEMSQQYCSYQTANAQQNSINNFTSKMMQDSGMMQDSSRRTSRKFSTDMVILPMTPMLQGFNHLEGQVNNDVIINKSRKQNMKREEFEEEISRNQLVFVDKQNKEMYVITPQFVAQKIKEDFQRNVQVLNLMFTQEMTTSQSQQQQQIPTLNSVYNNHSLSMFLNSPQLNNLSSNVNQQQQGEITPTMFSYYPQNNPNFISSSSLANQVNSPSMFFLTYSNANTPNAYPSNFANSNNNTISPAQQQQRMINQMPLNQLMNNTSTSTQSTNNTALHNAAILNKRLMGQDIQVNSIQQQQQQKQQHFLNNGINYNRHLVNLE